METRLLAILLADLSGYTEFSSRSERRDLRAAISQQRRIFPPVIDRFRGRLVKWIGDAVLAVFASATDAILCGYQLQVAFLGQADRDPAAISPRLKTVVHAGDVFVDLDGDVYGDAVNFAARLEKAAVPEEVYFSEAVRHLFSHAEIPHEFVGEFEFKGIAETAQVYRTCFGQSPVVRERVVLVQTNFVGLLGMADKHGWDRVHPVLDNMTTTILEASRCWGGTPRGTLQVGSLLSFDSVKSALQAIQSWDNELTGSDSVRLANAPVGVRVGIHWGTLHIMRHTIMGRDIDIAKTLSALALGREALLTGPAAEMAISEGLPSDLFQQVESSELRPCRSRERWLSRYRETSVFAIKFESLAASNLNEPNNS